MSGNEPARRERVARLGELAEERAEQARAQLHRADHEVAAADRRRSDALEGAAELARTPLALPLRGHLTVSGARHLVQLADERAELADHAEQARALLAEAVTRVRSLERVVERLDRAAGLKRRRQEAANLQDLVAIRAAREAR